MKILIADDHKVIRRGLANLLLKSNIVSEVVEANDGDDAILKAKETKPDFFILDYEMPIYNGIYAAKKIKALWPNKPILMFSMHTSKDFLLQAVLSGVKGYLSKEADLEELIEAIVTLKRGETYFKDEIGEIITNELINNLFDPNKKKEDDIDVLTKREREILVFFAKGNSSVEVAEALSISKRTAEVHKANIYRKLAIKNNSELMRYAIKNNLIKMT